MPTFRKVMETVQANPAILDFEFTLNFISNPEQYILVHYPNCPLRFMNAKGTVFEDCVVGFSYYSAHISHQVIVAEMSEDRKEFWLELAE